MQLSQRRMQKRPKERKQQRHVAMTCDTSKLVVGKSERKTRGQGIILIYLQVILAARISKKYLLIHVGNLHIHSQNLIDSLSRLDT